MEQNNEIMENPLADSIESFIYKLFENPDFLNEI